MEEAVVFVAYRLGDGADGYVGIEEQLLRLGEAPFIHKLGKGRAVKLLHPTADVGRRHFKQVGKLGQGSGAVGVLNV